MTVALAVAPTPLHVALVPQAAGDVPVDGMRLYLTQISRFPLLTAAEEVHLGVLVQAGKAQEASGAVVRAGQDAHGRLVQANLRLVISVARRYVVSGAPFNDLVQEGNLGLIRAADGFDPAMGCKFSTYATWWIRQAVGRAVADHVRLIRVPSAMLEERGRLLRLRAELWAERGSDPDVASLAEQTGHPEEYVRALLDLRQDAISLDDPVPGGGPVGASTCGETVVDGAPGPVELAAVAELSVLVERELMRLDDRDRALIELRFGLAGRQPVSVNEAARVLGIPRDRCRTLEAELLARLRARSDRSRLHDFLRD